MGDLLPGVALRSTPGYLISPLRGLRSTARHSRKCVESMDIKCQEWNSAYAKLTKAARVTNTREAGSFDGFGGLTAGKLRDQGSFSTVSLTHRTGLYCERSVKHRCQKAN